jgi:flagellar hook-associated protein 1 FlgK
MAGNLLNIGKTGLFAAQAGLATTGHNIANANVAGYSRQVVVQSSMLPQDYGYGFVGNGTQVADIKRYSDEFLNVQVRSAQSASSSLNAYSTQINQVDNLLADPTSGLSPALQDFFKAVQDLSSNPAEVASRQALLANGEALTARFQGMNGRLEDLRQGVNDQITSNVNVINTYAQQIARLNDQIGAISSATGSQPNDLLDARDQLVLDLNKQVKATVLRGDNSTINISIGNGQPLVMGNRSFSLTAMKSATDPLRLEVGYVTANKLSPLPESAMSGGELGGLLEFRTGTLDPAQNALGRIAIAMADTINAQHQLGKDAAGVMGGKLFNTPVPLSTANVNNIFTGPNPVSAAISDVSKLTASDYSVSFDGTNYSVSRLPDGLPSTSLTPAAPAPAFPQTLNMDGIDFTFSGAAAAGDKFLVRPTVDGAAKMSMAISDPNKVAAAAPIMASALSGNKGSARITDGVVDKNFLLPGNQLATPATLAYDSASSSLSGFPLYQDVTVTTASGTVTTYPGGTAASPLAAPLAVPFTAGDTISFGGITVTISGQPADLDKFVIDPNAGAAHDNRNMRLIGELQAKGVLDSGKATYQSSYAQLVGTVGNKAREVQVNAKATESLLMQASGAQQNVAGVNLDEEAANLLKYQQAYQAAGKAMQIASTLFDTLLSLGR